MKTTLINDPLQSDVKLSKPYDKGFRNYVYNNEQILRLSEGCPNGCEYCAETKQNGTIPIYYDIPEITHRRVKILDMNLIYKPNAIEIIKELGSKRVHNKVVYYELVCGIDYRFMTQEIANLLHENRFINIRLAWDYGFNLQKKIKSVIDMLIKSGYKSNDISIFMVCNWKISYNERLLQMDLCKIWRVKINDCWFDNQLSPNIKPIFWTPEQIKDFRHKVRKHNQMVLFGIDPEFKELKP